MGEMSIRLRAEIEKREDDVIFHAIANAVSLRNICKVLGLGTSNAAIWALRHWLGKRPEKYAEAKRMSADALADEALSIGDNENEEGKPTIPGSTAEVSWLKLRAENRKWLAAMRNPETFGQTADVQITVGELHLAALKAQPEMIPVPPTGREIETVPAEVISEEPEDRPETTYDQPRWIDGKP